MRSALRIPVEMMAGLAVLLVTAPVSAPAEGGASRVPQLLEGCRQVGTTRHYDGREAPPTAYRRPQAAAMTLSLPSRLAW